MTNINYSLEFKQQVEELLKKEFDDKEDEQKVKDKHLNLYALCYDSIYLRQVYAGLNEPIDIFNNFNDFVKKLVNVANEKMFLGTLFDEVKRYVDRREEEERKRKESKFRLLESPGGTMHPESKFYIEREADKECWDLLNQRKPLIFVQSPRETGKSSLLQRMLYRWQQASNRKQVFMDFQKIPIRYFSEVEGEKKFYIELCEVISEQLNLESKVNDFWKGENSLKFFEQYLTNYILQNITNHFIIAIDETERLLKSLHKDDFFGWLKSWQGQQNTNSLSSLTILFSISNEYYLEVENPETDLLTFASVISLADFTPQQVHHINQQYSKPLPDDTVQSIITLVGGHPALTRLAIHKVATGYENPNDLLANATKHDKLFGEHLKRFYSYISQQKNLKEYLTQLCVGQRSQITSPEFLRLEQAGVIKKQGNEVVFRNKLYNDYFSEYLLSK